MAKLIGLKAQPSFVSLLCKLPSAPAPPFGSALRYCSNVFEISSVRGLRCQPTIHRCPRVESAHGVYVLNNPKASKPTTSNGMTKFVWPGAQSAVSLFPRQLLSSPSSMFGSTLRYNPNIFEISRVRDVRCLSYKEEPLSEHSLPGPRVLVKRANGKSEVKKAPTCEACGEQFEKGDALIVKCKCDEYFIHKDCESCWFEKHEKYGPCSKEWDRETVTLHTVKESAERPKWTRKWGGILGCVRG